MIDKVYKYINNSKYLLKIEENNLYIANYNKIYDISDKEVIIKLINKKLIIKGNDLLVSRLNNEEININGIIKGIDFIEE